MKMVGLNGLIVDAGEAVISVYDHGFLYGLGLFETFRTYGGRKSYLLERHLHRLRGNCAELGIPFRMKDEEVRSWVRELLAANGLQEGYIRLTVSAGVEELGLPSADYSEPSVILMAKTLPEMNDDILLRGRELRLLRTRRNSPEGATRSKSLHYMNNILAKRELLGLGKGMSNDAAGDGANSSFSRRSGSEFASSHGNTERIPPSPGTEGLMLSVQGFLAEGIVSNLFFARGGIVYTPAVGTGILPGITRERVMELAVQEGLRVKEGFYTLEDLQGADEIWITNSIQELIPITTLTDPAGKDIAASTMRADAAGADSREAGPITRRLLELYRADTVR